MFNWLIILFKKKPKKKAYNKSEFTRYRINKGNREYYCQTTNEWLLWSLIADTVFDDEGRSVDLDTQDERFNLDFKGGYGGEDAVEAAHRYTSTDSYQSAMDSIREDNLTRNSYSDYSGTRSSSYSDDSSSSWTSSSSSSSSYDSGSCGSSSSGGGCD